MKTKKELSRAEELRIEENAPANWKSFQEKLDAIPMNTDRLRVYWGEFTHHIARQENGFVLRLFRSFLKRYECSRHFTTIEELKSIMEDKYIKDYIGIHKGAYINAFKVEPIELNDGY